HVEHHEHAAVADMTVVVDGDAADIDANPPRLQWNEFFLGASQRVVDPESVHISAPWPTFRGVCARYSPTMPSAAAQVLAHAGDRSTPLAMACITQDPCGQWPL